MKNTRKTSEKQKEVKEKVETKRGQEDYRPFIPIMTMQKYFKNKVAGFDRISRRAMAGFNAVLEDISLRVLSGAYNVGAVKAKSNRFYLKSSHIAKSIQSDEVLLEMFSNAKFKGANQPFKVDWLELWRNIKKQKAKKQRKRDNQEDKSQEELIPEKIKKEKKKKIQEKEDRQNKNEKQKNIKIKSEDTEK